MLRTHLALRWVGLGVAVSLAGCASAPSGSGSTASTGVAVRPGPAPAWERDGAEARPPAGLENVPDAEPRVETVRAGGPNKPYVALGKAYTPITDERPYVERGLASWYGKKFHGRRTASGEPFDMYAMTAAHPTLPIPSYARVRNPANGREVVVRINDRGPFHSGRIVDLSYTAALKLGVLRGVTPVELERITPDDIRTGAWQRGERVALQAQRGAAAKADAARTPPVAATQPAAPAPSVAAPVVAATTVSAPVTATPVVAATRPAAATVAAATTAAPATADSIVAAASAAPPAAPPAAPTAVADASTAIEVSTLPPPAAAETSRAVASAAPSITPAQPPEAGTPPTTGYWVQIGAFGERGGAERFQRRVASEFDWLAPLLAIFDEQKLHRLQAGPYPSRGEATSALLRIGEALQLTPVLVERR